MVDCVSGRCRITAGQIGFCPSFPLRPFKGQEGQEGDRVYYPSVSTGPGSDGANSPCMFKLCPLQWCHEGKDNPCRALYATSNNSRPVFIACDKYIDGEFNPMLASSHPPRTLKSFSRARNMTNSIGKPALRMPNRFGTCIRPTFGPLDLEFVMQMGPRPVIARPFRPQSEGEAIWAGPSTCRSTGLVETVDFHPPLRPLQAGIVASLEFRV